jgi:hypothetical protein
MVPQLYDEAYDVQRSVPLVRCRGLSKPHLTRRQGPNPTPMWLCYFGPKGGYGRSPREAYDAMRRA